MSFTRTVSDHYAADVQFKNRVNTDVVPLRPSQMKNYFGFKSWPETTSTFELGNRTLTLISIPGHDEVSIALYDPKSKILLTGDSFYPGRLYVRDWAAYTKSIARLSEFCDTHQVKWILGNHIEMKDSAGLDYPTGSTYQPHEPALPLTVEGLASLKKDLNQSLNSPCEKFMISLLLNRFRQLRN